MAMRRSDPTTIEFICFWVTCVRGICGWPVGLCFGRWAVLVGGAHPTSDTSLGGRHGLIRMSVEPGVLVGGGPPYYVSF